MDNVVYVNAFPFCVYTCTTYTNIFIASYVMSSHEQEKRERKWLLLTKQVLEATSVSLFGHIPKISYVKSASMLLGSAISQPAVQKLSVKPASVRS